MHALHQTSPAAAHANAPDARGRALAARWRQHARRPGVTAAARSAAPTTTAAADLDPRVYTDAAIAPACFVSPAVAAAHVPGKGRGLLATQPLSPGQLLLVAPPLALVEAGLGDIPDHDELQEVVAASGALYSPWQAAWLQALATTTSSTDSGSGSGDLQQLPSLLPPADSSNEQGVPFEALGMDDEQLWAAIVLNCFGEGFSDLPATICAGAPLNGLLGLWGPFSLLNHACRPNAVNFTLRDRMVVRCVSPIAAGEEVVINYLGRAALRPLSQRQLELQACYGFRCSCSRCTTEATWGSLTTSTGRPLDALLDQVHADIGSVYEPRLAELLQQKQQQEQQQQEPGSPEASTRQEQASSQLLELAAAMQQQCQEIVSATRSSSTAAPGAGQQQQEQAALASAFDLLGLLHDAQEAVGRQQPAVQAAMLAVCQHVCPGSDLHLFQALRRTSAVQSSNIDDGSEEECAAFAALRDALRLRFGEAVVIDEQLLRRMIDATSQAAAMVSF